MRKVLEIFLVERSPVFSSLLGEQMIVVFPKRALVGRTFSRFSGPLRFRTEKSKMDIAEADLPGSDILLFDLATRASGKLPTVRSLKIAKLDQCDGCIGAAAEMADLRLDGLHQGGIVPGLGIDPCAASCAAVNRGFPAVN